MPTDIKGNNSSDELRLRNYRTQVQHQHERDLRELEEKNGAETQKAVENHAFRIDQLRNGYDVQISQEAERLQESLHEVRLSNEKRLEDEKRAGERALEQQKKANSTQLAEEQKNSDAKLDRLRKQLQTSSEALHERSKKLARKEKEISDA